MNFLHTLLSVASGGLVGFTLGLVGGGGFNPGGAASGLCRRRTIAACRNRHQRNCGRLQRRGQSRRPRPHRPVKWSCALVFALSGIAGAAGGAQLGKMVDGGRLLMLFGALMVVVGLVMLKPRKSAGNPDVQLTRSSIPRLLPLLIGIGFLS